jgi:hypothetical protein
VVLFGETARVPLGSFVPVHPPPAAHEVALVEDQAAIEIWPEVMLVGFAENATVGGVTLLLPPAGYTLFDPGKTGTPPGTSTSTILTLELTMGWFEPSCTTLVPDTRSVTGMVTAKVRHVLVNVSGYGQGVECAWPLTTTLSTEGTGFASLLKLNRTRTALGCGLAGILSTFQLAV